MVWLHGDHLSDANPALAAFPDAPVVFVFDEEFLASAGFAFHRLFFLYESVLDVFARRRAAVGHTASCSLRRGRVPDEVVSFARAHGARQIVTTDTLGERFAAYRAEMAQTLPVRALPAPLLVPYEDAERVPRRFSVWWRQIESDALRSEDV